MRCRGVDFDKAEVIGWLVPQLGARWLLCNHESLCSEVKVGVAQANQSLDFIHSATQALPAKLTQFRKRFVKLSCGALMFARCE